MTYKASQWLAAAMLLAVATTALATESCHDCGLCPAGTAANFWELGEPDFALGFGKGTPNGWNDVGDLVPLALAETDCGTDLQVGGSCESFCVYVNKYKNKYGAGSFFAATFTSNGWAAEGPKAGTYCGLGNYYQFKENKGYFFVCGAFPWKLCCRSPGYTPYIWPGPGFTGGLERSSADMSQAITAPGQLMPLDADIIDDVLAHKTSGNKYKDQPLPAGADKLPADLPAWARELVARKFRV